MTGQEAYLAGHCPLTGRYFEPCLPHRKLLPAPGIIKILNVDRPRYIGS